ncbi:MAG: iron ABC transporter permease [Eubacteriales bacterium]|nr:iron ABC transporter permease [Eubacteriales bacterium]
MKKEKEPEKKKTKIQLRVPIKSKRGYALFLLLLVGLLAIALILAVRNGSVDIDVTTIRGLLLNRISGKTIVPITWEDSTGSILWDIRLPRVLTAFVVGAGLTLCGLIMQALTKNSLADPFVLGISHGASAGAVSVIVYGYLYFLGHYAVMFGAFVGAVLSIALAMRIAVIKNKVTATQLVLAGIAVAALFGAVTNLMIYTHRSGSDKVKTAQYWLLGSLSGATWEKLTFAAIALAICAVVIFSLHHSLDVLLLGDEVAVTMGVNTERLKVLIIILGTLLTGVIVSISGVIGFVGLTIPHITRMIVGTKHRRLIPAAILVGGIFLVCADTLSRVLVAPEELPIGVVSAFFGAPFFLYLIRKSHGQLGGR